MLDSCRDWMQHCATDCRRQTGEQRKQGVCREAHARCRTVFFRDPDRHRFGLDADRPPADRRQSGRRTGGRLHAGPKHRHPNGEIDLCFTLRGEARFDGRPEGWVVYGQDTTHVPTVRDGQMLILYFLPGGAIEFLPA